MIPVRPSEVDGVDLVHGETAVVADVAVDSRVVRPGGLFVALRGRERDGHEFVHEAGSRGAAAVLCERGRGCAAETVYETGDTLAALGGLARLVRDSSRAAIVGIAGSAGKTSAKDVLRALCAPHRRTVASPASFNNEVGVPLTLFQLEPETQVAVCELGTGGRGEILGLCAIARPEVGVLTCIGSEHLEFLGSVLDVAAAEAELLRALPAGGAAVLPYGEPLLEPYRRSDVAELTFGLDRRADVHPRRFEAREGGTLVELAVCGQPISFRTPLRAPHHRHTLCCAVAAYRALGLPLDGVGEGAGDLVLSPWRGEERRSRRGALVVNDAYNANPTSMGAAIEALAARRDGGRALAILGGMAELGAESLLWHRRIGHELVRAGVDLVVAVGPLARGYLVPGLDACWFETAADAAAALPDLVLAGDVILLKGSRSAGLERLEAAVP